MTRNVRKSVLFIGAGLLAIGSLASAAAAADNPQNPQQSNSRSSAAAVAAAPSSCIQLAQPSGSGGQHYRNADNSPFTYTSTSWFNVSCGKLDFTVPRGQQALVSLGATAELDCNAAAANADGWCQGRFLVNGKPALPDNTGRSDTYAWDSTNGGADNWSAHQLTQALAVSCPRSSVTTKPCTYTVQLQGHLDHGANSVWLDDLTVSADITLGAVKTTTTAP